MSITTGTFSIRCIHVTRHNKSRLEVPSDKYSTRTRRHGVKTREPLALVTGLYGYKDTKDPRELKQAMLTTSTGSTGTSQALSSMGVEYQRRGKGDESKELVHQSAPQVLGLQRHCNIRVWTDLRRSIITITVRIITQQQLSLIQLQQR
jgi:hypothetical protein